MTTPVGESREEMVARGYSIGEILLPSGDIIEQQHLL